MEELFGRIKNYLLTDFEKKMLETGGDIELVKEIKALHLTNIEKMLEVARVYDAKKFSKTSLHVEAEKFLDGSISDFKKLFPWLNLERLAKK